MSFTFISKTANNPSANMLRLVNVAEKDEIISENVSGGMIQILSKSQNLKNIIICQKLKV